MWPVDHPALRGGEGGDDLGRGQHLRLAVVERGVLGRRGGLVVVGPVPRGGVLVVVRGGGVGLVRVVGGGGGGGLGRGRVGVALPLAPFEARIWELGLGSREEGKG